MKFHAETTDTAIATEIRSLELPHRVVRDGKPAIDWMGMAVRSPERFRAYIDLRNEARRRNLPALLGHE